MKFILEKDELEEIKKHEFQQGYDRAMNFIVEMTKNPENPTVSGKGVSEKIRDALYTIRMALLKERS